MSQDRRCRRCKRTSKELADDEVDFGEEFTECSKCDPKGCSNLDNLFIPTEGDP